MSRLGVWAGLMAVFFLVGCGGEDGGGGGLLKPDAGADGNTDDASDAGTNDASDDGSVSDAPDDGSTSDGGADTGPGDSGCVDTAAACALADEQRASDKLNGLLGDPVGLKQFLTAVPKGGDLHNHMSGDRKSVV